MTAPPKKQKRRPTRASVARELRAPERDVLAGCLEACRALGIPVDRQNTGALEIDGRTVRFGRPGDPDIDGVVPPRRGRDPGANAGRKLSIETKRPGERPTEDQFRRLREINAAGGIAFYVDDVADCFRVLRRVLDGAWIEIDEDGIQWVVWDEPGPQGVA